MAGFNAGLRAAGFPTSSDIWLEVDGQKVAVVQGYSCKASRTSMTVEAFGRTSRWPRCRGRRAM